MNDLRNDPTKPSAEDAFTNLRAQYGAYFDAIPDVDAWVKAVRRGDDPDLRTADQRHADEIATLHRRLEALETVVRSHVQVSLFDAKRLDALEQYAHTAKAEFAGVRGWAMAAMERVKNLEDFVARWTALKEYRRD